MTTIVNQITSRIAVSNPYDSQTIVLGAIAVLVLLMCLILKELIRAGGHPRLALWLQVFNIAIVPLTIAFVYVVIVRFLALLPT